jgi:hypothetical protein
MDLTGFKTRPSQVAYNYLEMEWSTYLRDSESFPNHTPQQLFGEAAYSQASTKK